MAPVVQVSVWGSLMRDVFAMHVRDQGHCCCRDWMREKKWSTVVYFPNRELLVADMYFNRMGVGQTVQFRRVVNLAAYVNLSRVQVGEECESV